MDNKFTVGLIVANRFGVLTRVAGLFAKRNYNIDSLSVGKTENPDFSRMTIVTVGDEYVREQVVRQLEKLHDVKAVWLFSSDNSVSLEHMLVKLCTTGENSPKVSALINAYGGKVMDFGSDFITAEITGHSADIDRFLEESAALGILEVCRSGLISMVHGTENILSI